MKCLFYLVRISMMLLLMFGSVYGQNTEADAVIGRWFTEGRKSLIEVYKCGSRYCGEIVWLKNPKNADGTDKLDINNPDPSKRNRKRIGLTIVWGFEYTDKGRWGGGKIYDPTCGKTYSGVITMEGDNLNVRCYIGTPVLGKTIICTRKTDNFNAKDQKILR